MCRILGKMMIVPKNLVNPIFSLSLVQLHSLSRYVVYSTKYIVLTNTVVFFSGENSRKI